MSWLSPRAFVPHEGLARVQLKSLGHGDLCCKVLSGGEGLLGFHGSSHSCPLVALDGIASPEPSHRRGGLRRLLNSHGWWHRALGPGDSRGF